MQLTLDAVPGKTYDGKVLAINPLVEAAGRSIVIRAVIRNNNAALRPGMFARVRLMTDEKADSMVVPEQALVPAGEDQFVFKVIDGRATRVKVDIGQRRDGRVEILRGLEPSDVIVTAGQLKIRDGTAVKLAAAGAEGTGLGASASAPGKSTDTAKATDTAKSTAPAKQ